jgi:hypothetical protein
MTTTKCRSCGKEIFWAKSAATGKAMPINAQADVSGNITIDLAGCAVVGDRNATGLRYTSHFVTCPQAQGWRRKS